MPVKNPDRPRRAGIFKFSSLSKRFSGTPALEDISFNPSPFSTQGRFPAMLDGEDGLPFSATKILAHPQSGDLVIGSSEGVSVLTGAAKLSPELSGSPT